MWNKMANLDGNMGDLNRDAGMEDTVVPVALLNLRGEQIFPVQGTCVRRPVCCHFEIQ
jgi:hypothetical protein